MVGLINPYPCVEDIKLLVIVNPIGGSSSQNSGRGRQREILYVQKLVGVVKKTRDEKGYDKINYSLPVSFSCNFMRVDKKV